MKNIIILLLALSTFANAYDKPNPIVEFFAPFIVLGGLVLAPWVLYHFIINLTFNGGPSIKGNMERKAKREKIEESRRNAERLRQNQEDMEAFENRMHEKIRNFDKPAGSYIKKYKSAKLDHYHTNPKHDYKAFLVSDFWAKRREKAFEEYGECCEFCGSTDRIHVHHTTYEDVQTSPISDLMILCNRHHFKVHKVLGKHPLATREETFKAIVQASH